MTDNKGNSKSANPIEGLVARLKPDKMSGRMMKYPYTMSAKIASFPFKYYAQHVWLFKYYVAGVGLSMPIFMWFQKAACSPANVAKFEAKKAAEH